MRMIGPKGKFSSQPDDERTHIFISSGTGNAPFVAMMRQLLIDGHRGRSLPERRLDARELGYRDILDEWEAPGPTRSPTSRRCRDRTIRAKGMDGRTGRVETILGRSWTSWG